MNYTLVFKSCKLINSLEVNDYMYRTNNYLFSKPGRVKVPHLNESVLLVHRNLSRVTVGVAH